MKFDTVPSSAASYAGSSVPTTPDVHTDVPPRLLSSNNDSPVGAMICICSSGDSLLVNSSALLCPDSEPTKRRLSHDSGSYELEDLGASCVEASV